MSLNSLLYLSQNQRSFYFSSMKNDTLSQSLDLSQLVYNKKNKSRDSLMICQCPCRQQISQNQKIITLQNDYIKTLELQNLRRNQERIYLEAEIKQLRLQLDQPKREKQQLVGKVQYYKNQYQRAQNTYKQLQVYMRNQQMQLMMKTAQINKLQSNIEKLQLQNQMMDKNNKQLQQKLNQVYNEIEGRLPRQRKNSIIVKQEFNSSQIIENINRKWQQYCEQVKFKIHSQMIKQVQKLTKQIDFIKNQKKNLQKKIESLLKQIKNQKTQKEDLQRSYRNLQGSYRSIQENYNNKITAHIQSNRTKLQEKIKDLQNQLFQQEMNNIKNSFSFDQIKQNTTSSIEDLSKLEKQLVFDSLKTQNKQIQTSTLIEQISQSQTDQMKKIIKQLQQRIRLKDLENQKLHQKIQTMNKVIDMMKSKTIQTQKSMQRAQSSSVLDKKIQAKKEESEELNQGLGSLFSFLLSKYSSNAEISSQNIKKLQQIIHQKDQEIKSLQNSNRLLKESKMNALQNSNKILQLQKQNHKLKRQLNQAKQGLIKSRGSNKSHNDSIIEEQNLLLGAKKPLIPKNNTKSNMHKSSIQAKPQTLYRSQYQYSKDIREANSQQKKKENSHQSMEVDETKLKQKYLRNFLILSQMQKQQSPTTIKIKIPRVESAQNFQKQQ